MIVDDDYSSTLVSGVREQEGTGPHELALCIALGATFGLVPLPFVTTVLCTFIAVRFRLNLPLIQLVVYAIFPGRK